MFEQPYDLTSIRESFGENPLQLRFCYIHLLKSSIEANRLNDSIKISKIFIESHSKNELGKPPHNQNILMDISGLNINDKNYLKTQLPKLSTQNSIDQNDLTKSERELFVNSYKIKISKLRSSWRSIQIDQTAIENISSGNDTELTKNIQQLNNSYKSIIENEIFDTVKELLLLVENYLLPIVSSDESRVIYNKLCGDFCRYAAEIEIGFSGVNNINKKKKNEFDSTNKRANNNNDNYYVQRAFEYYSSALSIIENSSSSSSSLESTKPIRLGLYLNYSVYLYEIKNDKKTACEIAKNAFDSAIAKLDELDEVNYRDSTLLMQLLRDNLTLWTAQDQEMQ